MARIVWAAGIGESKYKGISAVKVYDEIVSIGDSATPEQIVEKARDESTELHKCFTWDDADAAEKWRKQEARQIRHFLVIRDETDTAQPELRAFHFNASGEGYKPPRGFSKTRTNTPCFSNGHTPNFTLSLRSTADSKTSLRKSLN